MLALVLPFLALAAAQSTANSTASVVDIEGVEANFAQAQLVPELLTTFTPQGLLDADFGNGSISTGVALSQTDVASSPTLTVVPASNATDFASTDLYTIIMTDANPVGTDESATEQTRHWLVNSASLDTTTTPYAVNWTGSTSITDYAGPGPASGSGAHRYVLLVYAQPSTFAAPSNLSTADTALGDWFLTSYVEQSGLGDLLAANYFTVENGVSTITVESTTAVESSTLAGYGSTTVTSTSGTFTNAATSGASGKASATSGAATASASASSSTSGAGRTVVGMGAGAAVVAAALVALAF